LLSTAAYTWREVAREMELGAGRDHFDGATKAGTDEEDETWLKVEVVNAWASKLVRH